VSVSTQVLDKQVLADANINPETGLATDYLNHYNEVAMLIDMLNSMPDVVEDILEWSPITYPEHFHITGFRAKELAIEAFNNCDPQVRSAFDSACRKVERAIQDVQAQLATDEPDIAAAASCSGDIYNHIAAVGGLINPGRGSGEESDVWNMSGDASDDDQAAIDALFD
tara:strand:- start:1549 stop:2055 length:507 start_codon:yes stop_codon:yes gene_type:complete